MRDQKKYIEIKEFLINSLMVENAFWSYDKEASNISEITDEMLIALTLKYLDLKEIDLLKEIFSISKIKSAWLKILVPEGDYLYSLNRFLAWYYFDIKKPDMYLKSMETRHLNNLVHERTDQRINL